MKALKNQNNMLFKISNKTIILRELNNINKINKASYYYLSRDGSSVYSYSDSRKSAVLYLSDWEVENPLRREIDNLEHIVINNIKSNQVNDIIYN